MKLKFTKMHGCGNDYVYINCFEQVIAKPEQLAANIARRRFSIGGDGLILICPSSLADVKMKMYNADGSEGKMCGNGIRCVAKYAHDNGLVSSDEITVETLSGIKKIKVITGEYGKAIGATVDMGRAFLRSHEVPVKLPFDTVINRAVNFSGQEFKITCVSMGNPHAVVFTDMPVDELDLPKLGGLFEKSDLFPEGVNTEFVNVLPDALKMRVWERGSGETLACGTGACAVAVAAVLNNFREKSEDIHVRLTGGELIINYAGERVLMTGPAVTVFEGVIEV